MSKKGNARADVKNPNNPAYKAAHDNRSQQLNSEKMETDTDEVLQKPQPKIEKAK